MDYLSMTIGKQKNIALIAHDQKKHELMDWCLEHKEALSKHFLLCEIPEVCEDLQTPNKSAPQFPPNPSNRIIPVP